MTAVDLADVQGLIVRGYTMGLGRHIGLGVRDPGAAALFLGALGDPGRAGVAVSSAERWADKPDRAIAVGLTFSGLTALRMPEATLASFPAEFASGAVARAAAVGDAGASAPENWLTWLRDPGLDILLFVSANSTEALEAATDHLRDAWGPGCVELGRQDGQRLPGDTAHFGFRDGLSQPTVVDLPVTGLPDQLPLAPLGAFLLGHDSPGLAGPAPVPTRLGINGSFAAVRVLAQDVDAFAEFLTDSATRTGMSEELLAAKLCGRWRNGTPLVLSPDTDSPQPPIPDAELNDFDYVGNFHDEAGYRCPIGSHIRRMSPRGERIIGNSPQLHRIIRRGIPYGPPYDPAAPRDGHERGLLGLFICASLRDQFEFLMANWANDGTFTGGLGHTQDPLLGGHAAGSTASFTIPDPAGPIVLEGLSRFVHTRGGAYCFLPSMTALRALADLAEPSSP
ncbi:MAG: peroxidase [Streptosporangiaceae bacterium]|nr:peroxidase [Streptosporangiaceae bacterium]